MKPFHVLAALVLLETSASATSVANLPLTRVQRSGASPKADRTRAALFKSRTGNGPNTVPATDLGYVQYTISVGIGNPPTYYNLVVDTGSSNTFCGTGNPYVRTNTSIPTGQDVNVTYGVGNFSGVEYLDQVTLAPNLVIANQSIGDALESVDFEGVDGIIGVGPVDLTNRSLAPDRNATVPTVMNNLVAQHLIKEQVLGIYFAPPGNDNDTDGALTFGGIDPSLYKGELTYVPVTETYPSSLFWGINITSKYGAHTVIPTSTAGIVDTGTTQVLLAEDYFDAYMTAIPGATYDANTGLIEIPPSAISTVQPLEFNIGGRCFPMDVAAQLVPQDQNVAWGGVAGKQYGVVGNLGNLSGAGLGFILGQKFIERYYVVFDADAKRVGFGQTNYTFSNVEG